ncbi:MAG TPA: dihydrofolate reductase family protein [Anaerolineales bacterium]
MRKLVEATFVTLDGVISDTIPSTAVHASPEKWGSPYWDDEHAGYAHDLLFSSDALLLGRVTYQGFLKAWPSRRGDFADRINSLPKYVASRTLAGPLEWNATLIEGDIAEQVARLKEQPGQNILKYGTGELDRTLMAHDLVDEFHFWKFPVAVGAGQHLFEGIDTTHLKLVKSTPFASGIVVLTFAPK